MSGRRWPTIWTRAPRCAAPGTARSAAWTCAAPAGSRAAASTGWPGRPLGGRGSRTGAAGDQRAQTAADQAQAEVDDQVGGDRAENVTGQVGGDVWRVAAGELSLVVAAAGQYRQGR